MSSSNAERVAAFVIERENARKHKEADVPWAASTDSIINEWRFCNVRREDDRVTRWLKKHWRDPNAGHPNMVGAMLLARMVNWPPTLGKIGFPLVWSPEATIISIHNMSGKAWSSAYIVSTCGQKMDKARYVVQTVSEVMAGPRYTPQAGDSLASVWTRLRCINGLGAGFIAGQVIADLKYIDPVLIEAPDWWTWAVSGPGSRRGLNRYVDRDYNRGWNELEWKAVFDSFIKEVQPLVESEVGGIHAQDWQNVLCEFDKYERVRLNQGFPRKRYTPETAYQI